MQPIIQPPPDDDDGDPGDQGPMPRPVMGPNGPIQQAFPGPTVGPNGQVLGTSVPMNVPAGRDAKRDARNQAPTTSPRPGALPQHTATAVPAEPIRARGKARATRRHGQVASPTNSNHCSRRSRTEALGPPFVCTDARDGRRDPSGTDALRYIAGGIGGRSRMKILFLPQASPSGA